MNSPLKGSLLVLATLALSLGTFMQVLDSSIANVAIPTISGSLGASTTQGTWVITSFVVANAISLPLTGWFAKRFGEVKLFIWSTALFTVFSWLCGLSSSLEMLIFFRVMQGLVSGPMIPLSQSLLLANYPTAKRNTALALWSMTVITAPIFGPVLGGYITDNFHWTWIFFINVPFGILVVLLTSRVLEGRETPTEHKPMDTIGLGLMVLGIGSLQIMLDQGRELGWFNSTEIIILTVVAVVSLTFFIVWELTDDNPVIDLSLFAYRNFTIAVICTSLGYMIYFGVIVLLPLLMQTNLGYTASWSGWASAPVGFLPLLFSPLIGRYAHKVDLRILVSISFMIYSFCFLWRATLFSTAISFEWIVWPQFVQGAAVAFFFIPLTAITLSGLPANQLANASSLSNFMRTLAGSIGASITTTLWDNGEAVNQTYLTEHVNPYNPAAQQTFESMHQLGLNTQQTAQMLAQEITQQSYILSANTIFTICGVMFLGLLVLIWFAKPPFSPAGGNSGAH